MLPRRPKESAEVPLPRPSRVDELRARGASERPSTRVSAQPADARLEGLETTLHDLQSPVAVLDVCMKLLSTDLVGARPEIQETLRDARRATHRIRQYIDHLVVSERLRVGAFEPRSSMVDLRALLAGLVDEFGAHAELVGATVSSDLPSPEQTLSLPADETLLSRVFQNLLENALRHAGAGGRVLVTARRGSVVEVRICNDGPRVPREQREQLFRKFAEAPRALRGGGLGLYFCRLAVEAHRGTLILEDEPVWPVCFVVRIPVAAL
jgi:two-component system, OmpR family, heavy metal sensor histidine kinase CusS